MNFNNYYAEWNEYYSTEYRNGEKIDVKLRYCSACGHIDLARGKKPSSFCWYCKSKMYLGGFE